MSNSPTDDEASIEIHIDCTEAFGMCKVTGTIRPRKLDEGTIILDEGTIILVDGSREPDETEINPCKPIISKMICRMIMSEISEIKVLEMIKNFLSDTSQKALAEQTEAEKANSNSRYSTSWDDTNPLGQKELFKFDYNQMTDSDLEKFADLLSKPEFSKYSLSINGKNLYFEQGTTETHRKTEIFKTIQLIKRIPIIQKIRNFIQSERFFPYLYIEMHPHKNSRKWTEAENLYSNPELILEQKRKHLKEYIKSVFKDTISSDFDELPEFFENPTFLNDRILINYEGITIKQLELQIDRCLLNADEYPPSHIRAAERLANIPVSVPLENQPFSSDGLNEAAQLIKLQKQRRVKVREKLKEVKEYPKIHEAREVLKRIRKIQGRGREAQTEPELEQRIQEVEKRLEPQLEPQVQKAYVSTRLQLKRQEITERIELYEKLEPHISIEKSIALLKKLDEPIREGDEEEQEEAVEAATEAHGNKREALSPESGMTDSGQDATVDAETESHNTERAVIMQDAIAGFNISNDKNPTHGSDMHHSYTQYSQLSTALSH